MLVSEGKEIAPSNILSFFLFVELLNAFGSVAERTSYFCLARKLIWPLWSTHILTQWRWLILFIPDHFSGQHQIGESPPNYLFLRIFWTGLTYLLSAPFIAAALQHHPENRLIYGPLESTFLDQGFPVEYELNVFNLPHTGTLILAMSTATRNFAQTSSYFIPGQHFLETVMFLSHNIQDHTFTGDYIIPVLN